MADPLTSLAGRSGQPFRMVVEEGKVHEFARAAKSPVVDHLREVNPVAPVTFLASAALWMRPENSAWFGVTRNFANVLHGEQEFLFHSSPPVAQTQLQVHHHIGRVFTKEGRRGGTMTFTEAITTFWTDAPERPVAEAIALSIQTGDPARPSGDARQSRDRAQAPASPPVAAPVLEPFTDEPLSVTDFVRYQGASGDFNPIHHDTAFAQAAGFPGPFAVGMLPAAIAACRLSAHFGALAIRRYRVRWQNQAWPGEALTYTAYPCDDPDFDVCMDVTRPDGSIHLRAWARIDGDART